MKSYYFCLIFILILACSEQQDSVKVQPAALQNPQLPELSDKNILIVYGGWDGHQPQAFADLMQRQLTQKGAKVDLSDTTAVYGDSVKLQSYDLIVQSITMDQITRDQMNTLSRVVQSGVGFAGAHGGFADAFRSNTEYQYMTGGQFVAHPGGQIDFKVNITNSDHLITRGIEDFETHTEQYYMHVDPNVEVLASTTFDGAHDSWIKGFTMPVAWVKRHGAGKVFYLSVGHDPKEFEEGPDLELLMNGLRWATR